MSPNFTNQDFVLVASWPWSQFRAGQVVLVLHPKYQLIIKRIYHMRGDQLLLAGDNPCSTATSDMGWVDSRRIVGKVYWRIHPPLNHPQY